MNFIEKNSTFFRKKQFLPQKKKRSQGGKSDMTFRWVLTFYKFFFFFFKLPEENVRDYILVVEGSEWPLYGTKHKIWENNHVR